MKSIDLLIVLCACLILVLPNRVSSNLSAVQYYGLSYLGELVLNDIANDDDPLRQIAKFKEFIDNVAPDVIYSTTGIMLGYRISQLNKKYSALPDMEYIRSSLPPVIKDIPWGMSVTFYNEGAKQYLCASEDQPNNTKNYYKVYSSSALSRTCMWNLNIEENGRHFTFQNNINKRKLFTVANLFEEDPQRQTVCTTENSSYIVNWNLEPMLISENGILKYQIRNTNSGEYLHASQGLSEAFTTEIGHCVADQCQWILTGTSTPLPRERKSDLAPLYAEYLGRNRIAIILLQHASNSPTRKQEYRELFELMKRHDGFYSFAGMTLDYNVEQLLIKYPNDFDLLYINSYFRTLWKPFPWNRKVLIKAKNTEEHLCATDSYFKYTNYTVAKITNMNGTDLECYWKFETNSNGLYFRIKTFKQNRYLVAVSDDDSAENNNRNRVLISNDSPTVGIDLWNLMYFDPSDWPAYKDKIRFKNEFWDETLYNYYDFNIATSKEYGCLCFWQILDAELV